MYAGHGVNDGLYTFNRATLDYAKMIEKCDYSSNNCDGNLWYRGLYDMKDSKVRLVLKLGLVWIHQLGTDFQTFIL